MDDAATTVVRALLGHISRELSLAAGIAKAVEACAESGNVAAAVKMAMEIEDHAYTADRLLKAILLIRTELQGEVLA